MTDETQSPINFDEAARRLDHALSRLEVRMSTLAGQAESSNGSLFDEDRAQLATELDAARARERQLEEAGAAASQALARAIAGVRAALGE
jgi:uncharacterized protein DUF4164